MGKAEIIIFIILANLVLLILITGIITFVFRYRKRKILYEKEKQDTEEQHRAELLNARLQMQRQTMDFIGREIHDSVSQKLTLASIYTQRMEFENSSPDEVSKLAGVSKIINDSLTELRQLSQNLTDDRLQAANLNELILMECGQVNATGICFVHFEAADLPAINIAARSALIRIVQEFIQNSIKHADCRRIEIKLDASSKELTMLLSDDGKGFDPEHVLNPGSGLNNIRRRIQLMEGKYNFIKGANGGITLTIAIPLNESNT